MQELKTICKGGVELLAIICVLFCLFPMYPHTEADSRMLADVMWLENGHTGKTEAENRECLILTGSVVLNRMKSGEWGGKTVEEVIFCRGQYASHTKNNIGKTDTPDWVYELAEEMMNYGTNVPDYVIFQSQQPKLGTRYKVIDGEYFATSGGHKDEGVNQIAAVNSHYGRDIRIFDYVWGNSDRTGVGSTVVDYIRWHGYIRNLVDLAMAYRQRNGVFLR